MILVTGASGTNGGELIRLLSERCVSVRGMVRRTTMFEPSQSCRSKRASSAGHIMC